MFTAGHALPQEFDVVIHGWITWIEYYATVAYTLVWFSVMVGADKFVSPHTSPWPS